jgi:hypothetical protein
MLYSGSLVFTLPAHPVDLRDWRVLWGVSIQGQEAHPVLAAPHGRLGSNE